MGPLFGLHLTGCYGDQGLTWDDRFYLAGWFPDFDDQVTADQPVPWRCVKLWCSNRHGKDAEPGNQKGMVLAMPECFNYWEAEAMDTHYPGFQSAVVEARTKGLRVVIPEKDFQCEMFDE